MGDVLPRRTLFMYSLLSAASASAASLLLVAWWDLESLPGLLMNRIAPLIPARWFELGIQLMGGYAKPSLYAALVALQLLVLTALGYGWLARTSRSPITSLAILALLCTLFLAATLVLSSPPTVSWESLGGTSIVALVWAAGLWLSRESLRVAEAPTDAGRRRVLATGLWSGLALAGLLGGGLLVLKRVTITSLSTLAGRTPPITPTPSFYLVSKNLVDPAVDPSSWRLVVDGAVENVLTFTLEELRALPAVEHVATMECISNPVGGPLISTGTWKGVRLMDILSRARPKAGAFDVVTMCHDGYSESLELADVTSNVLLVYELNGELLTREHGAPVRLQVPGRYGLKSSKWVEHIRLVDYDYKGYWPRTSNWTDLAFVHYMSRIDVPPRNMVPRGGAVLTGVAYTGLHGISKVEVSTDDGQSWQEAQLEPSLGPLAWRLWSYPWVPSKPGTYTAMVRVTDANGLPQELGNDHILPQVPIEGVIVDGHFGLHSVNITVPE